MPFSDRLDAGRKLAAALVSHKNEKPVILALPRGGVPVAAEIAAVLEAPLDLILVRKIGVPFQPELAMGALADGEKPTIIRNEDVIRAAGVTEAEFRQVCDAEQVEIERRRHRYLGGKPPIAVKGRTVIVVDDGIATGATTRAALQATRRRGPEKLILAVPVAPSDTLEQMRKEADEVVCLEDYAFFGGISQFYGDFRQVSDEEVVKLLSSFSGESNPETDTGSKD
jgi:predicted phosphoribosyltransferase